MGLGALLGNDHLAIGHSHGQTVQIFRSDGMLVPGPRTDTRWNPFSRALGAPSGISFAANYIQIGAFRIGTFQSDWCHLSVSHKGGQTSQIYKCDGTRHPGPRTDWNPWNN